MRVYISQSNFMPWWGFWTTLEAVDLYVIYDTVQFTHRDWRTRNRILQDSQQRWLSVPVHGSRTSAINQVLVADNTWTGNHIQRLRHAYGKKVDKQALEIIEDAYLRVGNLPLLTLVNETLLRHIARAFDVTTTILRSETFNVQGSPSERLAQIANAVGAREYVTGEAARAYLAVEPFERCGITVNSIQFPGAEDSRARMSILHSLLVQGLSATRQQVHHSPVTLTVWNS